jgi:TetR/AcrR family transcriptional regulator
MGEPTRVVGRRERRRTGRKELSRQDILDAAEHVFGLKGYHEASLQEIAERAEFSTSALYRFFDNKEALFIGVLARRGDDLMQGMRDLFALNCPPRQKLHQFIDYAISFYHQHPNYGRLFLRSSSTAVPNLESIVEAEGYHRLQEARILLTQLFLQGQRCGEFVGGDPAVLARLFIGLMTAYLAADSQIMGDDADVRDVHDGMPLEHFHGTLDRTFVLP